MSGTGGRTRTDMRFNPRKILSLVRLPISPHRQGWSREIEFREKGNLATLGLAFKCPILPVYHRSSAGWLDLEGFAAAAGAFGIGVSEFESSLIEVIGIVHHRSYQNFCTDRIDHQVDAML